MNLSRLNCRTSLSTFSSSSCSIWVQVFPLKDSGMCAGAGSTSSIGRVQKPSFCLAPSPARRSPRRAESSWYEYTWSSRSTWTSIRRLRSCSSTWLTWTGVCASSVSCCKPTGEKQSSEQTENNMTSWTAATSLIPAQVSPSHHSVSPWKQEGWSGSCLSPPAGRKWKWRHNNTSLSPDGQNTLNRLLLLMSTTTCKQVKQTDLLNGPVERVTVVRRECLLFLNLSSLLLPAQPGPQVRGGPGVRLQVRQDPGTRVQIRAGARIPARPQVWGGPKTRVWTRVGVWSPEGWWGGGLTGFPPVCLSVGLPVDRGRGLNMWGRCLNVWGQGLHVWRVGVPYGGGPLFLLFSDRCRHPLLNSPLVCLAVCAALFLTGRLTGGVVRAGQVFTGSQWLVVIVREADFIKLLPWQRRGGDWWEVSVWRSDGETNILSEFKITQPCAVLRRAA